MTDFGRRTGQGDMLKSVYDPIFAAMQALAATHATQHRSAGTDSIKLDDLAAPDDNTDLDFNTTKHGLTPKGTNVGSFLKDDGSWAAPVDANAIHGNVANEILQLTNKANPCVGDILLIEDFENVWNKKRVTVNSLQMRDMVDRGDPSAWDWTKPNLDTDGNWHDLDCAAVVPQWATWILFRVLIEDNAAGSYIQFRKRLNVNERCAKKTYTQVAGVPTEALIWCPCHQAARLVEYRTTNTAFSTITITILGWFLDYTI